MQTPTKIGNHKSRKNAPTEKGSFFKNGFKV